MRKRGRQGSSEESFRYGSVVVSTGRVFESGAGPECEQLKEQRGSYLKTIDSALTLPVAG